MYRKEEYKNLQMKCHLKLEQKFLVKEKYFPHIFIWSPHIIYFVHL